MVWCQLDNRFHPFAISPSTHADGSHTRWLVAQQDTGGLDPRADGEHADAEALGGLADLEKRGQARHPPRAASAASTPAGASEARIRSW